MDKNPTLIILTPGFPKNEDDTTCLPPQQVFVKALKENFPGLSIIVLSFIYPFSQSAYSWKNIPVISFNGKRYRGPLKFFLWKQVEKKLKQLKEENNILGILSFWCGECALLGSRFGRKHHTRHFCWILGQDAKKENKYVKRIHPEGGELIALSDFIQSEFEKNHGIKPAHIIPPGIDTKEFPLPSMKRDIDVLGAGSLIPLKQYDIFVETISELKKTNPSIKALICGKGPERQSLQTLISHLGLEDNITLAGELPHAEALQLMRRCSVFLHPSSYEGFGVVCIEALYAGAPVISFCKPMNKDISHWHIVQTKKEMIEKTLNILQNKNPDHQPVLPYRIDDTAKSMMRLFSYKEVAIS